MVVTNARHCCFVVNVAHNHCTLRPLNLLWRLYQYSPICSRNPPNFVVVIIGDGINRADYLVTKKVYSFCNQIDRLYIFKLNFVR